jgi:hypothetical protein
LWIKLDNAVYEGCLTFKQCRDQHTTRQAWREAKLLDLIHDNSWASMPIEIMSDTTIFITFIDDDDFSRGIGFIS